MSQAAASSLTFVFTDIAGSTRLWERHPADMPAALERHDALLTGAVQAHAGRVFKTTGDGLCAVFDNPVTAVQAAAAMQRAVRAEAWGTIGPVRVRIALVTGPADERGGDYYGLTLSRAARLLGCGHGGQVLLSQATADRVRQRLAPDIGLRDLGAHGLRGFREPERVYQLAIAGLPDRFPPLSREAPRPTNLPAQLTSFVGREAETAAVCDLLRQPAVRLVTLTGPGGTGKTRLALHAATTLQDEFEHGTFFVSLGSTRQAAQFLPAVAQALGVFETGGYSLLEALRQYLRARQALLLLDNFEQLLETAPVVTELLAAAPGLKVLVTSREALQVYGEHRLLVPPLPLPDLRLVPAPERVAQNAAVALLLERANALAPADPWRIDAANARPLAEICARLEGLPLAIELVAARLERGALSSLLAQLSHRLTVLADGPRDLPARQRTMRGAIDWSYALLPPEQQHLFAAVAVFGGGFTAAGAQVVAGDGDLRALVEKNLLRAEPGRDAPGRYSMLEVLREYALERLAERGQAEAAHRRHAAYYRELVERAEPELSGVRQVAWFATLKDESDNLRAALSWSLAQAESETALRLCGVLWRYWAGHSLLTEGRQWLAQALKGGQDAPQPLRARALQGAGRLAMFQNDFAEAEAFLAQSLEIFQRLDDGAAVAWTLNYLGETWYHQGDYARALPLLRDSLARHRAAGSPAGVVRVLNNLGNIARRQGDLEQAERLLAECLPLQQALGSPEGTAVILNDLGEVLRAAGQDGRAADYYQQSLDLYRRLDYPGGIAVTLHNLACVQARQGNHAAAAALFRDSLETLWTLEEKQLLAQCLAGLAGSLAVVGDARLAARLFGAALRLLQQMGAELEPVDRAAYAQSEDNLRARLGLDEWLPALEAGAAWPLDEALAAALQSGPDAPANALETNVKQGRQDRGQQPIDG
jgi:predicted ATPase/class 3 adenylate cyclase/Tfp pilus assembly protein PilF